MIIVRPIQDGDYDALHRMAVDSGHGFTSLPVNEALLKKRIAHAEQSFAKNVNQPGDEGYLFGSSLAGLLTAPCPCGCLP